MRYRFGPFRACTSRDRGRRSDLLRTLPRSPGDDAVAGETRGGHAAAKLVAIVGVDAYCNDVRAAGATLAASRSAAQATVISHRALREGLLADIADCALTFDAVGVEVLTGPFRGGPIHAGPARHIVAAPRLHKAVVAVGVYGSEGICGHGLAGRATSCAHQDAVGVRVTGVELCLGSGAGGVARVERLIVVCVTVAAAEEERQTHAGVGIVPPAPALVAPPVLLPPAPAALVLILTRLPRGHQVCEIQRLMPGLAKAPGRGAA